MTEEQLIQAAKSEGFDRVVVGAYVCNENGDVLFLRRATGEYMEGIYELPSGNLEAGESLRAAVEREVLEETGLQMRDLGDCISYLDYMKGQRKVRQLNFLVLVDPAAPVILSSEHDAFLWIGPNSPQLGLLDAEARRLLDTFYERRTTGF